ncbi:MAG: hypothetical protein UY96_C0017G0051 [Parcubacteria group bacterium GW2011_GWB1_56_8]|nr:MAG: hypothetical protein UY96_C0017G0051 [Parcubacteria group bacterium GW2011_GWB1_56_8]
MSVIVAPNNTKETNMSTPKNILSHYEEGDNTDYEEEYNTHYTVNSYRGPCASTWKALVKAIQQHYAEHPKALKAAEKFMDCLGQHIQAKMPPEVAVIGLGYDPDGSILASVGVEKPPGFDDDRMVVRLLWGEGGILGFHWGPEFENWDTMSYDERSGDAGVMDIPIDHIVQDVKKWVSGK